MICFITNLIKLQVSREGLFLGWTAWVMSSKKVPSKDARGGTSQNPIRRNGFLKEP